MPTPDRVLGQASLNEREAFHNLIEALRVAESACRQLAFIREQPHWFLVQNGIEAVRDTVMKLATGRDQPLHHRFLI